MENMQRNKPATFTQTTGHQEFKEPCVVALLETFSNFPRLHCKLFIREGTVKPVDTSVSKSPDYEYV